MGFYSILFGKKPDLSTQSKNEEPAEPDNNQPQQSQEELVDWKAKYENLVTNVSDCLNLTREEVENTAVLKEKIADIEEKKNFWLSTLRAIKNIKLLKDNIADKHFKDVAKNTFKVVSSKEEKNENTLTTFNSANERERKLTDLNRKINTVSISRNIYEQETIKKISDDKIDDVIAVKSSTFEHLKKIEEKYTNRKVIFYYLP